MGLPWSPRSTNFSENVPVEFGFVDLANGNLHLEIPLADPAQRGALRYNARFVYDSRVWMPVLYGNSWYWTYTQGAPAGYSNPTGHYGWDVFYDFGDLTNELASPPHTGITSWAEIPMTELQRWRSWYEDNHLRWGSVEDHG